MPEFAPHMYVFLLEPRARLWNDRGVASGGVGGVTSPTFGNFVTKLRFNDSHQ